jgi:hypothetical protein
MLLADNQKCPYCHSSATIQDKNGEYDCPVCGKHIDNKPVPNSKIPAINNTLYI